MKRFISIMLSLLLAFSLALPAGAVYFTTTEPTEFVTESESESNSESEPQSSEQSGVTYLMTVDVNSLYTDITAPDGSQSLNVEMVESNKHIYIGIICFLLIIAIVIICVKTGRKDDEDTAEAESDKANNGDKGN